MAYTSTTTLSVPLSGQTHKSNQWAGSLICAILSTQWALPAIFPDFLGFCAHMLATSRARHPAMRKEPGECTAMIGFGPAGDAWDSRSYPSAPPAQEAFASGLASPFPLSGVSRMRAATTAAMVATGQNSPPGP